MLRAQSVPCIYKSFLQKLYITAGVPDRPSASQSDNLRAEVPDGRQHLPLLLPFLQKLYITAGVPDRPSASQSDNLRAEVPDGRDLLRPVRLVPQ